MPHISQPALPAAPNSGMQYHHDHKTNIFDFDLPIFFCMVILISEVCFLIIILHMFNFRHLKTFSGQKCLFTDMVIQMECRQ